MGTAPTEQQPAPMPDPRKFATQAVEALGRLGMSQQDAHETVIQVAANVRFRLYPLGTAEGNWLTHVIRATEDMDAAQDPSLTEHTGDDHANGSGS